MNDEENWERQSRKNVNEKEKLKKSTKFYCKGISALPNFELEELRKANHTTKSTFLTEIDDSDTEDSDEDEDETDNDKIFKSKVSNKLIDIYLR